MKLLIDCLIFENGKSPGYQEYLFNLLDYFKEHRDMLSFNNILIAIRANQERYFEKYKQVFEIRTFPVTGIVSQLIYQNLFEVLLGFGENDAILFTYNYSSIWGRSNRVLVVHDLQYLHFPEYFSLLRKIQRHFLVPISMHSADIVIAISDATRIDINQNFKNLKVPIKTIYNYCNYNKYIDKEEENEDIDNIVKNYSYFLSVSSLAPHKNISVLVDAFLNIASKEPNVRLVLVGSKDNLPPSIAETIAKSIYCERILFTGYIDNYSIGLLYRHCLAFVLPTLFEGFGMPIAEALYFNAITLLSDIPICHEIAEDKAYYFEPHDSKILALLLSGVLRQEIKPKIGQKELMMEKFSESNTSEQYIKLLNNLWLFSKSYG